MHNDKPVNGNVQCKKFVLQLWSCKFSTGSVGVSICSIWRLV